MFIKVNDSNVKEIVRNEVLRQNLLIRQNAIDVDEINLNYIDVSNVTDFSELFKDMVFEKPLNIENWDFVNCHNAIDFSDSKTIHANPDNWRG